MKSVHQPTSQISRLSLMTVTDWGVKLGGWVKFGGGSILAYAHTYVHTYCFQLLLCWSFLSTTLNYLQVSPSSPCVGSSLRNGVQVVRDTFEARQETEEDHTSLQEQTVSDTHHIHPTLHHHSTIQSSSYLALYVVVWHETCVQTHTVWGSWSCK